MGFWDLENKSCPLTKTQCYIKSIVINNKSKKNSCRKSFSWDPFCYVWHRNDPFKPTIKTNLVTWWPYLSYFCISKDEKLWHVGLQWNVFHCVGVVWISLLVLAKSKPFFYLSEYWMHEVVFIKRENTFISG